MVEIEFTDEFGGWFRGLTEGEQDSVADKVDLLERQGTALGDPHSSQIKGSRHGRMRELKIQHQGDPYRVFYAFDPLRQAILLIGGNKAGDGRFYEVMVPKADDLYDEYLAELRREGRIT